MSWYCESGCREFRPFTAGESCSVNDKALNGFWHRRQALPRRYTGGVFFTGCDTCATVLETVAKSWPEWEQLNRLRIERSISENLIKSGTKGAAAQFREESKMIDELEDGPIRSKLIAWIAARRERTEKENAAKGATEVLP